MTATTLERETLSRIVRDLPDDKVAFALNIIRNLSVHELPDSAVESVTEFIDDTERHEPNEETVKVLEDSESGRNLIGPFHNMNDFMVSLLTDDNA
ncbi:hypothetical protein AGMMS50276_14490 [Synergistales bacterium]|nr:hypothetical protein AGMMS50276_14490 [Synergistales bacterium]